MTVSQYHEPKTLLVTTGGTIESFYNPEEGTPSTVPQEETSCIPKALNSIAEAQALLKDGSITAIQLIQGCLDRIESGSTDHSANISPNSYDHYPLCMEDSKDVTVDHLKHLAQYIYEHDEYESIIIVHGTDTMPIHGRKLREFLADYDADLGAGGSQEKKVIFVGAMEPLRDKSKQWRPETEGWKHLSLAFEAAKNPVVTAETYFTYENQLLKSSEWNKHREVDAATNTVTKAEFVVRLKRDPHEELLGRIWQ